DQVKVNGRRVELGEIDAALLGLDGVGAAAAAVQRTPAGTTVLVGYVVPEGARELDTAVLLAGLRDELPASLIPLLAVVTDIPTRTSGKVDRGALPWPLPGATHGRDGATLAGTAGWVGDQWEAVIGVRPLDAD